jgi:hypothetical protein
VPAILPSRRVRFQVNAFEVVVAVIALTTCVYGLADPAVIRESTLNEAIPIAWAYIWHAGYGLAAVGIIAGLWRGRRNEEAAGLILMASAVAIQTVAVVAVRGTSASSSVLVLLAVTLGCACRAGLLLTNRRAILITAEVAR